MPTWKVSLASGLLVNRPDSIKHIVGIQISLSLRIAVSLILAMLEEKKSCCQCGRSDAPPSRLN